MRYLGAILAIVFSCGMANAAEIDFSTVLLDVAGKPYKDCAAFDEKKTPPVCSEIIDLTLGRFAAGVLNARQPNMTVQQLVERGQLAMRLYKGGKQPASVDDVKMIKDALPASNYPPLECYAAIQLLDPDSLAPKKP